MLNVKSIIKESSYCYELFLNVIFFLQRLDYQWVQTAVIQTDYQVQVLSWNLSGKLGIFMHKLTQFCVHDCNNEQ